MSNETEWVLVPREPSDAMLSAAHYELADKPFSNNAERSERAYAAMLAAAPQPPAEAQAVAKLVVEKDGLVKFIRPTGLGLDLPAGEYLLHLHPSPAEAQPVGGGGASVLRTAAEYHYAQAACQRVQSGNTSSHRNPRLEAWHRQVADAIASVTTPPSAPVGVDVGDKDCLTTCARELLADEYRKRGIGTGLVNDAGTATNVAIAAIATALAQQSAPTPPVGVEGLIEAAKAAESMLRTVHECASHECEDCREYAGISAKQLRDALAQQPAAVAPTTAECPHDWGQDEAHEDWARCYKCGVSRRKPLAQQPAPVAPAGVESSIMSLRDAANEIIRDGRVSRRAGYTEYLVTVLTDAADRLEALAQQPAAVDEDDFDCPHSAFDNCDCYADQQGGES